MIMMNMRMFGSVKPAIFSGFYGFLAAVSWTLLLLLHPIESTPERSGNLNYPMTVDAKASAEGFSIYWNVPTFQCHKYGLTFDYLKTFGIRHNLNDSFRGDKIAILYDPGNFPAFLEQKKSDQLVIRNGGVPQEGNSTDHLIKFRKDLEELIPDSRFHGIGIIDFESWRPVFRQNFGTLKPYQDFSIKIEKERSPFWMPMPFIKKEAATRFEKAARIFMEETLKVAKEVRPLAKWGFYAYPYCFNMNGNRQANCPDIVVDENNRIQWLWDRSDALYPSVYMSKNKLSSSERLVMVKGRVSEARRIASKTGRKHEIYPYMWYKYQDETEQFLDKADFQNALIHMRSSNLNGAIIWGSSNDVNSRTNCQLLDNYVRNTLGPIIQEIVPIGSHKDISTYDQEDIPVDVNIEKN